MSITAETSTIVNQEEPEHPTHLRLVSVDNVSHSDRYYRCSPVRIADRLQVARALDEAHEHSIDMAGGRGDGAGAFVEVMWGDDEDAGTERIDDPFDPLLGQLPVGSVWHARRFAASHERGTAWNGNNHVALYAHHTRDVIARCR